MIAKGCSLYLLFWLHLHFKKLFSLRMEAETQGSPTEPPTPALSPALSNPTVIEPGFTPTSPAFSEAPTILGQEENVCLSFSYLCSVQLSFCICP